MVVCKFFMEGYCKFGSRCKFDHVDPYGYDSPRSGDYSPERPQGTSILRSATTSFPRQEYGHSPQHGFSQQQGFVQSQQQGFGQANQGFVQAPQQQFVQTQQQGFVQTSQQSSFVQKPSGLKYNVQEIMQIVIRDITQQEKGGQWQMSCYSPLKELPNIPGLEDHSPEELRWECYKALQNGSLPLCQAIVQQLYANVAKINNELKRKDSGYSIIDRWLRDSEQRVAQSTAVQQTAFSSPFGGTSVTSGAFSSPLITNPNESQPVVSAFSFSLPQQQVSAVQPFQSSESPFSAVQTTTSAFPSRSAPGFPSPTSATVIDDQAYSTAEELSEDELKSFQAERFILGTIPTKPPPRMLCNS